MSGPKIDSAELERRRQEAIRREQEKRVRKIKVATDNLCKKQESFCQMCDKSIHLCDEKIAEAKKIGDESLEKKYIELRDTCRDQKAECLSVTIPTEPEDIVCVTAKVLADTAIVEKKHNERHKELAEELSKSTDRYNLDVFSGIMQSEGTTTSSRKKKKKAEEVVIVTEEIKTDEIDACLQEVVEVLRMTSQNDTREEAMRCYKMLQDAKGADSESQKQACTSYYLAKTRLLDAIYEFDNMYLTYVSEYVAYVETLNAFQSRRHAAVPKPKTLFRDRTVLGEEISHVRALSISMREHIYIREQLDAIMKELGYGMCEEIVFCEGQNGVHYICAPQEAGAASIHVYVSDHNAGGSRVMMEVVAADETTSDLAEGQNAKIMTGESMADYERDELVRAQGQFCTIHPQIVKKLAEKGIILTTVSHQEPDAKFCKRVSVAAGVCVSLGDYSDAVYRPARAQAPAAQVQHHE